MILKSRKFWAALVGLAVALLGDRAGLDADQLLQGVAVVVSYILGTALESARR